jgi:hypothetical protein
MAGSGPQGRDLRIGACLGRPGCRSSRLDTLMVAAGPADTTPGVLKGALVVPTRCTPGPSVWPRQAFAAEPWNCRWLLVLVAVTRRCANRSGGRMCCAYGAVRLCDVERSVLSPTVFWRSESLQLCRLRSWPTSRHIACGTVTAVGRSCGRLSAQCRRPVCQREHVGDLIALTRLKAPVTTYSQARQLGFIVNQLSKRTLPWKRYIGVPR